MVLMVRPIISHIKMVNNMNFKDRILYLDVLRALAIIFVVFWHVSNQFSTNLLNFNVVIPINSLVRIAIPIFLMISGALLIGQKKYDFLDFFKRRFSRIFIPHIFWVIIYFILGLTIIPDYYGLFNYSTPASLSISYFLAVFFSMSEFSALLWFVWCIIGFYLIIPILNSFVKDYGLKGIEYILIMSILCLFIPTFGLKTSSISDRLRFIWPFFTCYFYPILGYYIHNKKFNISNKMLMFIGFIVFVLGYCLSLNTMYFEGLADLSINYLDINHAFVVIESVGFFLMFKYMYMHSDKFKTAGESILSKLTVSLSEYSFGIYFIHMILIKFLLTKNWFVQFTIGKAYVWIPIFGFGILFVSWFVTFIMDKIPILKLCK